MQLSFQTGLKHISLVLLLAFTTSTVATPVYAEPIAAPDSFAKEITEIYRTAGTDALARHLRERADAGLDLTAIRQQILLENNNTAQAIEVRVHPNMAASVDFANSQLKQSGIDFFMFKALIDSNEPDPTVPFKSDAATYKKWRIARIATVPIIGFAASLAEAGLIGHGSQTPSALPTLARGLAILALELQFSAFSNWWNRNFWSADKPLINAQIPQFRTVDRDRFLTKMNDLVGVANKALRGVKRAHFYNYMVNYLYTGVVYTAGLVTALVIGDHSYNFNFVKILSDSFLITTAFFGAFGMNQILLGSFLKKGELSELRRFRRESTALWWNAIGRAVSLVPGLKQLGLGMQLSFGLFSTLPLAIKSLSQPRFNARTKEIFEANTSGQPLRASTVCQRLLEGLNLKLSFSLKR